MVINNLGHNLKLIGELIPHKGMTAPISDAISQAHSGGGKLLSELTSIGIINQAHVKTIDSPAAKVFDSVLQKLEKRLIAPEITLADIPNAPNCSWLMLEQPQPLSKALKQFQEVNDTLFKSDQDKYWFFDKDLNPFDANEINDVASTNGISNILIRGRIGYGSSSQAFLTSDYKVLKLSRSPNYPEEKSFIKDLDIPILKKLKLNNGLYCVINPFATVGSVHLRNADGSFDMAKFKNSWKYLNSKLEGTGYKFSSDFCPTEEIDAAQIGFIGDKPFLLDSECVKGRKLAE